MTGLTQRICRGRMRVVAASFIASAVAVVAAPTANALDGIRMKGLKADDWGTTLDGARDDLLSAYPGIARVACVGVYIVGLPRRESTWVDEGERYWDKALCMGRLRSGRYFDLVHDARGADRFVIYRLRKATVAELRASTQRTVQPPAPSPSPAPAPQPAPQPQPPTWSAVLLRAAYNTAVAVFVDAPRTSFMRYYHYEVRGCTLVSTASARCTVWLYKESEVRDASFRLGVERALIPINVFANLIDVATGTYVTRIEGGYFIEAYDVICSDSNRGGRADSLTRAGSPAPPCTP